MHVCGLIVLDPTHDARRLLLRRDAATRSTAGSHDVADVHPQAAQGPAQARPPDLGARTRTSTSTATCTGSRCPQPGGYDELVELCGHLAGQPLDRSRPLWEMWVIEGYDDDKIVVFSKMHHATVDGVSGANLISHLCSLEPDAPPLAVGGERHATAATRASWSCSAAALVTTLTKPLDAAKLLAPSTQLITKTHRPGPRGHGDGGAVLGAAHLLQRHHHRPPDDRRSPT